MHATIIVLETISNTSEDIITRVWTDLFHSTTTHFAKPTIEPVKPRNITFSKEHLWISQ